VATLSWTKEIGDAIERADRESFIQEPPRTLKGRIGFLIRQLGSAKAVAAEIGVTADSVNRYRRGARRNPPPGHCGEGRRGGAAALATAGPQAPPPAGRAVQREGDASRVRRPASGWPPQSSSAWVDSIWCP
jgi:DNA-binding transcriptional regulator YdaS (Cro superfamily)